MKKEDYGDVSEPKYEFIAYNKLESVYDIAEIHNRPCKIYNFFRENKDEVIYITQNDTLYGVISIGDMYRYYRDEEESLPINRDFCYVHDTVDFAKAESFFQKRKSIHEIPVINNGVFMGIIKKKAYEMVKFREERFWGLRNERMFGWKRQKIKYFQKVSPAKCYAYDMTTGTKLTQEQETILEKRRQGISNTFECLGNMSEQEQRNFVGKHYYKKFMEDMISDYSQLKLCRKNGVYRYEDCQNETYHIKNGYRQVPNVSGKAAKRIWMFGVCTVFGTCVRDDETIEFYMQEMLYANGYYNYDVINAGVIQGEIGRMFTEEMSSDDIIILIDHFTAAKQSERDGRIEREAFGNWYKGGLGEVYEQIEKPLECMLDSPQHCNYIVNQKIAEKIFNDILPDLNKDDCAIAPRLALQNCFIPWDVVEYYEEYVERYELHKEPNKKTGAIVMNCNPFTLGHRYLIEQASKQVDRLYIFVVEEDKSYFRFKDRLEMVRQGTVDLDNVHVLPSGKYIISQETFAQYFKKENIIQYVDDMDYDIHIFGEVVADMLGISIRFVGEEPLDIVTAKYNDTMKRILPEYDIEVMEIPRKEKNGVCISASKVRKYLEEGEIEKVYMLVPESTKQYLSKNTI